MGAIGASLFSLMLGAPASEVHAGLWGYNSCLTAVAILTFFVPNRTASGVCCLAVAITVLMDAAMKTATAPIGAAVGTFPFCFCAIVMLLTHDKVPT